MGRWPWPRTRTAEIIQRLAEGGAKVIALDILMNEPDENSCLALARALADRYRALGFPQASGPAAEFGRLIEGALADADTDAALAQTLADTRRVLVPYFFVFEHEVRPLDDEGQRLLNRSRVVGFASADADQAIQPRKADGVQLPLARFITRAWSAVPWPPANRRERPGAPARDHAPRRRGSRASRSPSPRRLNPSTASMMASPGMVVMCGVTSRKSRPVATMSPTMAWAAAPRAPGTRAPPPPGSRSP